MGREITLEERDILEKLGTELRKVRKSKKLTLDDVSKETHIKVDYISKYENGKKEIGYLTLKKLCDFYNYKVSNLFYRLDYPASTTKVVELSNKLIKINNLYLDTVKKLHNELNLKE